MGSKTVMITGCNRGIGKEAVCLFAEHGYNLICCIRKENEDFSTFVSELKGKYQVNADILYFDMTDEESIKEALKPILKERRQIDVLVNNAGIATGGFLQMTSMKQLKEVFQINYFSHVAGLDNFAGYTAYGASKAAMMSFTRTIARELAQYNIRVNAIAPGLTDTGMAGQMEEKAWKEMVERTDMNRLGRPNEIAQMILFLASDKASFITGQVYRVDGGM